MCLLCLRTLFRSLPFVPITLSMSDFSTLFFRCRIVTRGVTVVCRQRRDGVYYWLKSVPLRSFALVSSSSVRSSFFFISMWHSHLGYPSLHIFFKFLIVLNISFLEDSCTFFNINKIHKVTFCSIKHYLFLSS